MSSPFAESGSHSTEHCVEEFHTSVILGMGINSDEEPQETDFVTRWLTTFPTNTSAQMECALERVNWDDILRRNENRGSRPGLEYSSDDSWASHLEDQLVLYSAYNSNVNGMFRQTAKDTHCSSLARYQDVVPHWQDHGTDELCHSRAMSDLGTLAYSAFEMEFANSNCRDGSPPSSEDAFNQNKLVLPTISAEIPEPYPSLSSRIRRRNVDLKLISVNVEDDAISKPPSSESLHSIVSREEKFKEQRKLTMKRKIARRYTESPSAPPCKRFSSASKTIPYETNECEEYGPSTSNRNGSHRSQRGAATDPQSVYARNRRERINERLKVLQKLVPNGAKVDISTMLEEAISYVKFLQLQVKFLSSEEYWMYTPIAYNGIDFAFNIQNGA